MVKVEKEKRILQQSPTLFGFHYFYLFIYLIFLNILEPQTGSRTSWKRRKLSSCALQELGDEGKEPRTDEDRRGRDGAGAGWRSRFIRRGRREWWGVRSSLVTEKKTQIYMIGGGGSQAPSDLATATSRHREEKKY